MKSINNKVTIVGEIISDFEFNHETYGEKFYTFDIAAVRTSGYKDVISAMISERLIDTKKSYIGQFIQMEGNFRSYNCHENEKSRLILNVFVVDYSFWDGIVTGKGCNQIELDGYICKQPIYRKTPLGRKIADVLIAVNRSYGKSDYIPCICWGRNARFVSELTAGTEIKVFGRIQSRTYIKRLSETESEERTAYEVSASRIEVLEDGEE